MEQKWKKKLLRKVKSTPFFKNREQKPIYNISIKALSPFTTKENELSKTLSNTSSDTSTNIIYENNNTLQNSIFHSKLNIYRDVYELDQKCVLYNYFSKKTPVDSNGLQKMKTKDCTVQAYDKDRIGKILQEIVETERSYVRGLEELIEIYIKKPVPIMLYEDSRTVFENVLPIFIFHKQYILPGMIDALNDPNSAEIIAEEFLKNKDFFKIYLCYVYRFQDKIHIIKKWENSEKGRKYLKSCRVIKSHNQLSLINYLLLPIQRIPRYKLLLFKVLQYCNSLIVRSAFNQICILAYNMNERKRQEESSRRLFQLQENLCYPNINIIEPWRKLIKESRMHYLLTTQSSFFYDHLPLILDREVFVVLCSDILIILNYTCTSIIKIFNVEELQVTHAWERPNIGLRFIFWELEEIWHFDAIEGDADEWVNIINQIHINS